MCIRQLQLQLQIKLQTELPLQLDLELQCNREVIPGTVALEIKLHMEHCMPVIHRVRVDFNIPGPPTQQRRPREKKIPPTKGVCLHVHKRNISLS